MMNMHNLPEHIEDYDADQVRSCLAHYRAEELMNAGKLNSNKVVSRDSYTWRLQRLVARRDALQAVRFFLAMAE
jgi:hypothetical protein